MTGWRDDGMGGDGMAGWWDGQAERQAGGRAGWFGGITVGGMAGLKIYYVRAIVHGSS